MTVTQTKRSLILLLMLVASFYNLKLIYFLVYFEEKQTLRNTSYTD